ncbi:hypothetical protein [Pareuzebyella sediminis]|uniref:hypothetical protein n=1 Tax=Pareuzebyella sediminis TaxID=2607998 RepID=UPI0011EDECF0|nr:hypothetical protein [Pareuzebyella sediminis]
MKKILRISLLLFWLFAIVAPSIITLCDIDKPVVVTNLNEEEHQETGKKSNGEEKFVSSNSLDFSLLSHSIESNSGFYHIMGHFDYTLEIVPPPPKHIG